MQFPTVLKLMWPQSFPRKCCCTALIARAQTAQLFYLQDKVGVDGGRAAEEGPAVACDVAQPRSQAQIPHYLEAQAAAVFPEKVLL